MKKPSGRGRDSCPQRASSYRRQPTRYVEGDNGDGNGDEDEDEDAEDKGTR